ncbi:hypothetical protein [Aureimonas glaciei]|uniref:DUF3644 domain-containing protein n=1 Tax=Aureimonas glaciei TaxID=1776957 RepID=A0A916Y5Y2_9HYPH|nr:hypothetical protein [Aureimonas glaciei]GGD31491.1 hypothetical protein GCM10011335_38140 [Aureimonas glaciei]
MAIRPVRDARTLKTKAIHSLKAGITAFNGYHEDGRQTAVLLNLQHACEMLLKAALSQKREMVFDKKANRSLTFEACVRLCSEKFGLTGSQAGVMRVVDRLRDSEQHWIVTVEEGILYLNVRALVTAFDEYLRHVFEDDLASHIPPRVLPVSTRPPGDFDVLVDAEYTAINQLLGPGMRRRDEARARIRSLLAMEAVVTENVEVSEKDVDRVEKAIRANANIDVVFPRLRTIGMSTEGEGTTFTVKFSKKEGAPVRFIGGDDPEGAAAVREVDLQKKFHMSKTTLAKKVKLKPNKCHAMRWHLGLDEDRDCCHIFKFGKSEHYGFSDNATRRIQEELAVADMEKVWARYQRRYKD